MTKRTIVITSFHGLVSRVLECGLVDGLLKNNMRVVLVVPENKVDYFKDRFNEDVFIEGLAVGSPWFSRMVRTLAWALLPTRTMSIKWQCDIKNNFGRALNRAARSITGSLTVSRLVIRFLSRFVKIDLEIKDIFKKYNPSLVFSTDLQQAADIQVLNLAHKKNIKSVGMIRSWDNPTAKGLLQVLPDLVVAVNDVIKDEVVYYNGLDKDIVVVTGIPHYDLYFRKPKIGKEQFLRNIGIDEGKNFILFAPAGDRYIDTDWQVLMMLDKALNASGVFENTDVLVRLPPGDTVSLHNFTPSPRMHFWQAGAKESSKTVKEREMALEDVESLVQQIFYAQLVIAGPSTVLVDSVALDKPTIFYAVDGYEQNRPYCKSLRRYCDYEHLSKVINTGGVRLAKTPLELFIAIKLYLKDPNKDKEGRLKLCKEQSPFVDGSSTGRLLNILLENLR